MYIPSHFKNKNLEDVRHFLRKNSFGILISEVDGTISGTHVPMVLDTNTKGEDVLVGHLAKANPQSKNLKNNATILAIFHGPHSYVSSSWYHKEDVPTWNYIAVHIYGTVKTLEGAELHTSLRKLIDTYEQHSKHPVSIDSMSNNTLKQIHGIIGFSIKINEIQAAYKLSQNKNETDYHTITKKLDEKGDSHSVRIASHMKKNNPLY